MNLLSETSVFEQAMKQGGHHKASQTASRTTNAAQHRRPHSKADPHTSQGVSSRMSASSDSKLDLKGRVYVVLGPPAVGKGTLCKMLANHLGIVHLSSGDLCRECAGSSSELGVKAKRCMDKGDFIPDTMAIHIIKERLRQPDAHSQGVLLDGFPRTAEQARALLLEVPIDGVFLLQAPDAILPERAQGRRLDPVTGAIYHIKFVPPPPGILSRLLRRRADGDPQAFQQRIEAFRILNPHVLSVFSCQVWRIDGTLDPDEVFRISTQALSSTLGNEALQLPSHSQASGDVHMASESALAHKIRKPSLAACDAVDTQSPADMQLHVAPCKDAMEEGGEVDVMIRIEPPDVTPNVPSDVCCLVDMSASMGAFATYQGEDGSSVVHDGLTVADIVKHSVTTVSKLLGDSDRLLLVSFNHKARVILEPTYMTKAGQQQAMTAIEGMEPCGETNIWAGLLAAMETLRLHSNCRDEGRHRSIFLLTDGQPNILPPRGHVAELRDYMDTHPGFRFQLNTFGFGYNLDSNLLVQLAKEGNGANAFLPDALLVGTTFVNTLANVMSTLCQRATLSLMAKGGARLAGPVLGDYEVHDESWGRAVNFGPLHAGQPRELVLPMQLPAKMPCQTGDQPYLEVFLDYTLGDGRQCRVSALADRRKASGDAIFAQLRSITVRTGLQAMSMMSSGEESSAEKEMLELCEQVESAACAGEACCVALRADVEGRMSKALQGRHRFHRWGQHYLHALMRSHQLQICNNFMDPGLQHYGGTFFRALRDRGDAIFQAMPLPKVSSSQRQRACTWAVGGASNSSQSSRSPADPSPRTYYAGAGGG
eukprot:TRINITY_DN21218_c0_g1_i1.p1 TRINITY_DN21218_c0_g1~~TRINITY_DN21218_c0_g1_i1.p1  ORF type:complete len:823 (-),score=138.46 TRINITY_DN21218_c0_g1_i1:71-2539(-)